MVSLDDGPSNVENESSGAKIDKNILVIAQEIKIAKSLACNDPKLREKQLRKLRKWLKIRSNSSFEFSDEDFLRLWKGLYYCMWMSDKPLIQENLADDLGQLIDCFSNVEIGIQFFGAFLKTMCLEWFGIDQWRMDKFLMLVRRMLRYMLKAIKKDTWSKESIKIFNTIIYNTVLESKVIGLIMHFLDIFLEELAKISEGNISAKTVTEFIKPFITYMATERDTKLLAHVKNKIFHNLLWQTERGREYTEKYNAWKHMGFPTSSIHDLEKIENESESENEIENELEEPKQPMKINHLDPRAGNVDVFMPILSVDPIPIIKDLKNIMYKEITNTRSRKTMNDILKKYEKYESGDFPLGVKIMQKVDLEPIGPLVEKKLSALEELDNELYGVTRDIKKLSKKKRRKFLASINYDQATEDNFENIVKNALNKSNTLISKKKRKHSISDNWVEEQIIEPSKNIKKSKTDNMELNNFTCTKLKASTPNKQKTIQENQKKIILENEKKTIQESQEGIFQSEWDEPLRDGEVEYFIPSRKIKLSEANDSLIKRKSDGKKLLVNPYAKKVKENLTTNKNVLLGKSIKKAKSMNIKLNTSVASTEKKVKIVLDRNMAQKPSEYIRQVKNSPQVPYDSEKKPKKSLLKPNLVPSPINPFYKKKINLQLDS